MSEFNMGFCDDVTLERAYPEYGMAARRTLQSKSLYAGGGIFTITRDGKLVEHLYRYEEDPEHVYPFSRQPTLRRVAVGERVIDYHGDILLYQTGEADRVRELVVRFTNGLLEWVRPLEDYPEGNRRLLVEQGAR
jgi:hypothetical protein